MVTISDKDKGILRSRIRILPIPDQIKWPIYHLFVKWAICSGLEWTIQRFKSVKVDLIRLYDGLDPQSSWVAKSRDGKTVFRGPFGALERWMLVNDQQFSIGVQLLMMYSYFVSDEVTPSQMVKFITSVQATPVAVPQRVQQAVLTAARKVGLEASVDLVDLPKPLILYGVSPSKRAPAPGQKSDFQSQPEVSAVLDSIAYLVWSKEGFDLLEDPKLRPVFESLFQGIKPLVVALQDQLMDWSSGSEDPDLEEFYWDRIPVGKISFLQESGYKLRYVANPARVFQRLLEPLGDALFGLLRTLPWDCTFDQSRGLRPIQEFLSTGKPVFSIDLSSATDYFPLSLQIELLRFICRDPYGYIDLFELLSRSDWGITLPNGDRTSIRWTKGQPLGLYPSFASFGITHGLLLQALNSKSYDGEFYVLGDDVVILDTELANRYLRVLEIIGCPISTAKTVNGPMAEFAGKLVTQHHVIPQLKWREPSDDSFLDIARLLGPRSLNLFRSRQRRVIEAVSTVPESLGGFGWNPLGLPIQERLPKWAIFQERAAKEAKTKNLSDQLAVFYHSWLGSFVHQDPILSYLAGIKWTLPSETLAQRAAYEVNRLLGASLVPMYPVLGKNLDKVALDLGIDLRLPYSVYTGSRITQLERWEAILSLS